MDTESQDLGEDHSELHAACSLCGRNFSVMNEWTGDHESICGHCKFLLLEDCETPSRSQQRALRLRRNRCSSSESGDRLFSLSESTVYSSSHATPTGSRGSDGFGTFDSLYEDSDVVSLSPYSGGSDEEVEDEHERDGGSGWEENAVEGSSGFVSTYGNDWFSELAMSWGGAPSAAAAASFVKSMPHVVITDKHESLGCAICKEMLCVGTVVNQLPCCHLFHPSCILPWLTARSSCPLCRYELPTNGVESHGLQSSEVGEDESYEDGMRAGEALDVGCGVGRRERWLVLAALPVVSVVGIVFALLWGKNIRARGRRF